MDLNSAAIFASVVDAGGFSAAARKLGIPKTTVSKRVADLERDLGVRLLNRTTRSVSLTEAGARLHDHCDAMLRRMEIARDEVVALQRRPEGLLRVGAPSAIGTRFLLPMLADLMRAYPALRVSLTAVNDDVRGVEDGLDVLVWPGPMAGNIHAISLIARVDIGLYASTKYVAALGAPEVPSALDGHRVVAFTQALAGGRFAWALTRGTATVTVIPAGAPHFLSNDAAAIMAAISAGIGIGALPIGYVDRSPAAGLIRVLPGWRAGRIELNAFFRDGGGSSAKNRVFLEAVRRWFRETEAATA